MELEDMMINIVLLDQKICLSSSHDNPTIDFVWHRNYHLVKTPTNWTCYVICNFYITTLLDQFKLSFLQDDPNCLENLYRFQQQGFFSKVGF